MRLNLGCSDQQIEGFIGVDSWTPQWATESNFLKADLRHAWPWTDSSVDFIRAWDIVEHLPDLTHTMNEIHRVLKPGGTAEIVVPTTDGRGAFQDPTHVTFINRNSFFYYTDGDPHFTRFHEAYGIRGSFRIIAEQTDAIADGVVKLAISLQAVKSVEKPVEAVENSMRPIFSMLHASARPSEWRKVYDAWMTNASAPSSVEYILICDRKFYRNLPTVADASSFRAYFSDEPHNYVANVNKAAALSTGQILIVNADDQYPCANWDERLIEVLFGYSICAKSNGRCQPEWKGRNPICRKCHTIINANRDFAISVSTETPQEHERGIMVMPILSRTRYEKYGYVFYPKYESMYADNDFCALAERDGVVTNARHLVFPHKHWMNGQRTSDAVDSLQNRGEAYELGKLIFEARRDNDFADVNVERVEDAPSPSSAEQRKLISVITPGNLFSGIWVNGYADLVLHIAGKYNLHRLSAYTTGVGIMRNWFAKQIVECPHALDYVLWLDDDNTLTPDQFEMLLADLEAHPEYDSVSAWCWVGRDYDLENGTATMSCGGVKGLELTEDGRDIKFCHTSSMSIQKMQESPDHLIEIDYSGFPAVLMRADLLRKAGKFPFNPYIDDRCEYGMSGEDIAFFARTKIRSGARYAVDRRVFIPHYKTIPIEPVGVKRARELSLQ